MLPKHVRDFRLALAAFPHWTRYLMGQNITADERRAEFADMAAEARSLGWRLSWDGEPVYGRRIAA